MTKCINFYFIHCPSYHFGFNKIVKLCNPNIEKKIKTYKSYQREREIERLLGVRVQSGSHGNLKISGTGNLRQSKSRVFLTLDNMIKHETHSSELQSFVSPVDATQNQFLRMRATTTNRGTASTYMHIHICQTTKLPTVSLKTRLIKSI